MEKFKTSSTLTSIWLCLSLLMLPTLVISTTLNQQQANEIAKWDNQSHYMNAQKNILIPRVVGSKGWLQVQNFIVNELESMGVEVEFDSFEDNVPIFGRLNFVNIIGRVNPKADKFLVLSAHYDSKYFQDHDFLGATDSAVPCAMILNLLKTTLPTLNPMLKDKNLGLMVIFFDGEEAFVEWNEQDSIYGSRHLAKKWANENYKNGKEIDRINVLVLLDLIGYGTPRFMCTFRNTCGLNQRLESIETMLKNQPNNRLGATKIFSSRFRYSGVDDDHKPFLIRNVPILHLIPQKFPDTWHTKYDNGESLNQQSILELNRMLRIFIIEYFADCTSNNPSKNCKLK